MGRQYKSHQIHSFTLNFPCYSTNARLILLINNLLIGNVINNEYNICDACQEKQKQKFFYDHSKIEKGI